MPPIQSTLGWDRLAASKLGKPEMIRWERRVERAV